MRENENVCIMVVDRQNPYRWVSAIGKVVEVTSQGADEHIDKMAKKYLGQDTYPFRQPGEVRLLIRIRPERELTFGNR